MSQGNASTSHLSLSLAKTNNWSPLCELRRWGVVLLFFWFQFQDSAVLYHGMVHLFNMTTGPKVIVIFIEQRSDIIIIIQ